MRLIMLVDMDYFYVACEELRRPEIHGKPAIVGADPKNGTGRGVVMTCSYQARAFGIRSGMPISTAYRLKPDAIFLPFDFDYYDSISARVMKLLEPHSDRFEQVSVDEAYMDVSRKAGGYPEAKKLADRIKSEIKDEIGLPCSIGISYNKLLAKMACERAKPGGIGVVAEEEAAGFLEHLPLSKLYGVGIKTQEKLEAAGYKSIGDVARANVMDLFTLLGSYGIELYNYSRGIDDSRVEENRDVKSISREATFPEDTEDRRAILNMIHGLAEGVAHDIETKKLSFKVVTVKIRYSDFTESLKSESIRRTNGLEELSAAAESLFLANAVKGKKVRKLGVKASDLVHFKGQKRLSDFNKKDS